MEGEGLSQRRLMSWSYSFGATVRVSSVAGLQRLYVAPENPNHKYPVRLLRKECLQVHSRGVGTTRLAGSPHTQGHRPPNKPPCCFLFISNAICLLKKC